MSDDTPKTEQEIRTVARNYIKGIMEVQRDSYVRQGQRCEENIRENKYKGFAAYRNGNRDYIEISKVFVEEFQKVIDAMSND